MNTKPENTNIVYRKNREKSTFPMELHAKRNFKKWWEGAFHIDSQHNLWLLDSPASFGT